MVEPATPRTPRRLERADLVPLLKTSPGLAAQALARGEHPGFSHTSRSFAVVVDANVLRNDLLRTVRQGSATVMVAAATSGILNIYCARHVIDEVNEHIDEWAHDAQVEGSAMTNAWATYHAMVLRCVDRDTTIAFSDQERARLSQLARQDADDLPSAELALALDAWFVSQDKAPLKAVYGSNYEYDELRAWLAFLQATGIVGAVDSALASAAFAIRLLGVGALGLGRRVPLLMVAGAFAGLCLYHPERRRRFFAGALDAVSSTIHMGGELQRLSGEALRDQAAFPRPEVASIDELAAMKADATRSRFIAAYMSQQPCVSWSAADLQGRLPGTHSTPALRTALRASPWFVEIKRGRFQLGRSILTTEGVHPS